MENQRGLTIVLWVVVLFGIFFLARGLTGKAVLDLTTSDQCNSHNLCSYGEICCNNLCYTAQTCSQITNSNLEKPQVEKNYLVDIGPGAGIHGGEIIVADYLNKLLSQKNNESGSVTLDYLRGDKKIEVPENRRDADRGKISVKGGNVFNIKNMKTLL